eukprot:CAMPEP_0181496382 /NCGR_PEP_ID=MMETSP1110-20121109/52943_1 /TAXON_ID=174948 /ORGANISM="Symbiodinium sp., Strain CCMP421" /LENGTH=75 /DNA_ID=CAMNT_0023624193 /DNA_START=173 /DNA_END=396 /DNA_ORIENTATION=-
MLISQTNVRVEAHIALISPVLQPCWLGKRVHPVKPNETFRAVLEDNVVLAFQQSVLPVVLQGLRGPRGPEVQALT